MSALKEALEVVYGDRDTLYGHPLRNARRTATMWSAILGVPVTPQQVVLCMVAMKISREVAGHHPDHVVDIAGYAENLYLIEEAIEHEARPTHPTDPQGRTALSPAAVRPTGSGSDHEVDKEI